MSHLSSRWPLLSWIKFGRSTKQQRRARTYPKLAADIQVLESRSLLTTVHFLIDPAQDVQPISRFIYGVNPDFIPGSPLTLDDTNSDTTFVRVGGNRLSAYNWENNASNAGSDYIFQNDSAMGGGDLPGGALIPAIEGASAHNAGILLTVPINGYVAADKNGDGDVRNSLNYLQTRFDEGVARKPGPFALNPNLADGVVYQDEFVNWVKANYPYGETDLDRPIWFSLDNEPDLWSSTHAAIHPDPLTYAELVAKSIEYADAIKDVAPNTKVFGPANYGFTGYINLQFAPDAAGRDFQEFYLQQLAAAEPVYGHRLLDVLDVHWYPEARGGGTRITGLETSQAVIEARLQAPRSLWDPTYQEDSYITKDVLGGPIDLLDYLGSKIERNYPGTKLAITEYNYGGGQHISGGIAQADVLGIFGREGLFAANQFPLQANEAFVDAAFRMYTNYDGANSQFGDTSIRATTDDVGASSIYASVDSTNPNVMILVAINKTALPLTSVMNLAGIPAGSTAEFFRLSSTAAQPQSAGSAEIPDPTNFSTSLPAYSVTTIRISREANSQSSSLSGGVGMVNYVKKQPPAALMPNLLINAPGGELSLGKVVISYTIPRKGLATDVAFANLNLLGTVVDSLPSTRKMGGTRTLTITLNSETTVNQVQSALRSFSFSTKKLDRKKAPPARQINVQVFDRAGAGNPSNTLTTVIAATSKSPENIN